jgi:hypothetical protein
MLKNFNLVNTEGLTGVFHKGRTVPFNKIDDALAEQLYGKTHVLERVTAPVSEPAQVSAAPEPAASEAEAPSTNRRRNPSN